MPTISLLIERNLTFSGDKIVAASNNRALLVTRAREEHLHIDALRLDRIGNCKINEFTQCTIEEVTVLCNEDTIIACGKVQQT